MKILLSLCHLMLLITASLDYPNSKLHKICWEGNLEALQRLKPIETENVNIKNPISMTPLHVVALRGHEHFVKPLMLLKADANMRDDVRQTPMHIAAENGKTATVHQLIVWGGRPTLKNHARMIPLHLAIQNGHVSTVDIFFAQHTPTQINAPGEKTLLHLAAEFGHDQIIKNLINFGLGIGVLDYFKRTPLHLAAANGHLSTVELLMDLKIDPMTKDFASKTAIDHAETYGHHDLAQKMQSQKERLKFASLITRERDSKTMFQELQESTSTLPPHVNKNNENYESISPHVAIPEELLQQSIKSLYSASGNQEEDNFNQQEADYHSSQDEMERHESINNAILKSEENRKSKKLPPLSTNKSNTGFFVTDINIPDEYEGLKSIRINSPETDHKAVSRLGSQADVKVDMSRVQTPTVNIKEQSSDVF